MSFDLVLFGGTGDLTWRKLMPALFQAFRHGKLPRRRAHPGGRRATSAATTSYRDFIHERFCRGRGEQAARPTRSSRALPKLLHYRRMDLSQPDDYAGLQAMAATSAAPTRVVLYLATSPHLFPQICEQLGAVGLNGPQRARRARKAARPRPGQRAGDQPRRGARCSARRRPSASTTTSASRRCRT